MFLSVENWLLIYTAVWCISAHWHWCNWTAHVDVKRYLPKAVHEINNRWPRLYAVAPRLFYLPLNTPPIIRLCFHEVFILSWMVEMHNKLSSKDRECGGLKDTLFISLHSECEAQCLVEGQNCSDKLLRMKAIRWCRFGTASKDCMEWLDKPGFYCVDVFPIETGCWGEIYWFADVPLECWMSHQYFWFVLLEKKECKF